MQKLKLVFAGTPNIAVDILDALVHSNKYEIQLVLTKPDAVSGRGKKLQLSDVAMYAKNQNILTIKPKSLKNNLETIEYLNSLKPDIIIVVAYGLIIPKVILDIPTIACINVHVSLLPKLRGAAPIEHAILSGDKKTGITIMRMDEGLDTGDILLQQESEILATDTTDTLKSRLTKIAIPLLFNYLQNFNHITPCKQDHAKATYAAKIEKHHAKINWNLNADIIMRQILAYNPSPVAYSYLKLTDNSELLIKIWKAGHSDIVTNLPIGGIMVHNKQLLVSCAFNTTLVIEELQVAGKNRCLAINFLNGYKNLSDAQFML